MRYKLVCVEPSSGNLELWQQSLEFGWIRESHNADLVLKNSVGRNDVFFMCDADYFSILIISQQERFAAGPEENGREVIGEL